MKEANFLSGALQKLIGKRPPCKPEAMGALCLRKKKWLLKDMS
jgi:hypothetical protein